MTLYQLYCYNARCYYANRTLSEHCVFASSATCFGLFSLIVRQQSQVHINLTGNVLYRNKPLLLWKSDKYYILVCVRECAGACNHTYPACNAPPYCHLRPLWLHHIFQHYLISSIISGRKRGIEYDMCLVFFFTTFTKNISHSKKNQAKYWHKCENVFM